MSGSFGLNIPETSLWVIGSFVVGYFILITFFGTYFSRFSSNVGDFFFSGRRFAWWVPFVSMMATGIGSYSYLKYSQQGLRTGMSSTLGYMNEWFIVPLFFLVWLPIIYFTRLKSVPEYFEKRFNRASRYMAVTILLSYIFYYIGYNFFTIGIALEGIFGVDPVWALPLLASLLGLYVTMGGQTAVIFTDLVQGVLLYVAGFTAFGYGIYALGGFGEFWGYLPLEHRNPFPSLRANPHFNSVGLFWGDALVGSIAFLFLNQGFLMRFLSIRSIREARIAGIGNLLITLPLSAIIVGSMGWIVKSILTKQKALGEPLLHGTPLVIENSFHTFVTGVFYLIQGSPIVLGLIFAALLAALMSTVDTLINAASAIGVYDIYKPLLKPRASARHYLRIARVLSISSTLIGLLLVIWFYKQKGTLMTIHYKGIMMIMPSLVTTLLMGMLWRRFHGVAALFSLGVGSLVSFLSLIHPEWIFPLRSFLYGSLTGEPIYFRAVFGVLVTGLTGVFVTWIYRDKKERVKGYTIDTIPEAMRIFKGGEPNLEKGSRVKGLLPKTDSGLNEGEISLPKSAGKVLKTSPGDQVYVCDTRFWLGGLRSGHMRLARWHHGGEGEVRLSEKTQNQAYLLDDKPVFIEKIL